MDDDEPEKVRAVSILYSVLTGGVCVALAVLILMNAR
jgi:hypothetical protein